MRKLAHPMGKLRYLLFALAALWAVPAIAQESTPNLSGIWRWNPDKSHVSGRPATNRRVKIEQQGSDLTLTTRVLGEMGEYIQNFHYTIGSDNNTNQMMGSPLKSKVHWKDGVLVVESAATMENGELHISETWTLSSDGQTLNFHGSRVMGDHPPREDTIVYEKQPEADWEPPSPRKKFIRISGSQGHARLRLDERHAVVHPRLGVSVRLCYVQGAFDKDDKHEKQTARKMLLMARQINTGNFNGQMHVTCWTCHRGSTEPESAPK